MSGPRDLTPARPDTRAPGAGAVAVADDEVVVIGEGAVSLAQQQQQQQSQPQPQSQPQSQQRSLRSRRAKKRVGSIFGGAAGGDAVQGDESLKGDEIGEEEGEEVEDGEGEGEAEGDIEGEDGEEEGDEEEEEEVEDDDDEDDVDNFSTSEIVTVMVGVKRKRFFLHRDLICERSPFMEKCLKKGRFDEGYKNELYLPEDDPKAFSIIVDWIYRTKLPLRTEPTFDLSDMSAAYCMADKFAMEELQNSIMDSIRASFGRRETESCKTPNFPALALTHLTGPHKSPLKRFYVEHLVHHMMKHPKWYHDLKRNEPARADLEELFKLPDLVFYIMKKVWQFTAEPWKDPALWDKCCYHVHTNTVCPARAAATAAKTTSSSSTAGAGAASGARHGHNHPGHSHGSGIGSNSFVAGTLHPLRTSHGGWPSSMGAWNNPGVGW